MVYKSHLFNLKSFIGGHYCLQWSDKFEKKREWLPHLTNSIPENVYGYTLSMYSIALEGWRRGLELKFYNRNRKKPHIDYSLRYKDNIHYFSVTRSKVVPKKRQ